MSKSVEEQLEGVRDALDAVETRGQRLETKDRVIWRADHAALSKREADLERRLRRQKAGGVRVMRIVPLG